MKLVKACATQKVCCCSNVGEADHARLSAEQQLKERILAASQSETEVRMSTKAREAAEDAMPPLREEEAVVSAILQRLNVQRDSLNEQEAQAKERMQTLENRIEQLLQDMERETGLTKTPANRSNV